jgi:hypothetical protein
MTATEAAAALEEARLQQHLERDREDLAGDAGSFAIEVGPLVSSDEEPGAMRGVRWRSGRSRRCAG